MAVITEQLTFAGKVASMFCTAGVPSQTQHCVALRK